MKIYKKLYENDTLKTNDLKVIFKMPMEVRREQD